MESVLTRLAVFGRSVIPADPWQLVYLMGVIFIFICPRLTWWSPQAIYSTDKNALVPVTPAAWEVWREVFVFAIWPIIAASLVAYYHCFWRPAKPKRRFILGVCLPALAGLVPILYALYWATRLPPESLLERRPNFSGVYQWFSIRLGTFRLGVIFASLG
jgi:hypothetical protein